MDLYMALQHYSCSAALQQHYNTTPLHPLQSTIHYITPLAFVFSFTECMVAPFVSERVHFFCKSVIAFSSESTSSKFALM